ncbi:MAG: hypothetical protein VX764_04620 [Planctomycetota bacterium]|nr:hypothetical protein [Planctomycetota bacterium]
MKRHCCLIWSVFALALAVGTGVTAGSVTIQDDHIEQQVIAELERVASTENSVRYRGQYAALIPLGTPAAQLLLKILQDEDRNVAVRRRAANALHDVITPELLESLHQAMDDLLLEPWVETELGLFLAQLGQRQFLDRWLKQLQQIGQQIPTTGNLAVILEALGQLGDLQFRSNDLATASATHRRRIALMEDLIVRVHPQWKQALSDEMLAIHYNLACCLALSGQTEQAFAAIEKSLQAPTIHLSMVQIDGDLRSLRDDPGWPTWLAKQQKKNEPPEPATPPQEPR